ncbi:hypothetical protein [Faunimonas pinastri]|nr:hypothetical protein [Faunimonas pinastri]
MHITKMPDGLESDGNPLTEVDKLERELKQAERLPALNMVIGQHEEFGLTAITRNTGEAVLVTGCPYFRFIADGDAREARKDLRRSICATLDRLEIARKCDDPAAPKTSFSEDGGKLEAHLSELQDLARIFPRNCCGRIGSFMTGLPGIGFCMSTDISLLTHRSQPRPIKLLTAAALADTQIPASKSTRRLERVCRSRPEGLIKGQIAKHELASPTVAQFDDRGSCHQIGLTCDHHIGLLSIRTDSGDN